METKGISKEGGRSGDARQPGRASLAEVLTFLTDVFAPTSAKGVLIRRPATVAMAAAGSQRLDPGLPLPATLNHFALRFAARRAALGGRHDGAGASVRPTGTAGG